MSMDATMQIRMSSELKAQVEELYHELGTSFAEAVRNKVSEKVGCRFVLR